jgi:hypothetical protein
VEYLAFRDGGYALHSQEHAALVNRLYQALLRREADPTGLTTWTDFLDAGGTGEHAQLESDALQDEPQFGIGGEGWQAAAQETDGQLQPQAAKHHQKRRGEEIGRKQAPSA